MKKIYLLPLFLFSLFSCEQIVLEDDITDEIVNLVAPADGSVFNSTGITFTWNAIENGSEYRIQIARPNFQAPLQIVTDVVVNTTSFTTQLNVGEYQWRVQGVNSAYETAYSTRSFTIISNEDFQNNSVTLSSPADNIITNSALQNLSWQAVIGATAYHLQVVNPANSTVIAEQDVTATNFSYTFPEGNYQWKVRATNGTQNTLYAMRSLLVDTVVPNTPTLTAPVNSSSSSDNDVSFQWTRIPVAGSAEKDSIYIYSNSALTTLYYKNEHTSPYNALALPDGTYYWFVKSFDQAGNVGQQSSVFSFTLN